ncbi:MAG: hypothetical protein FJX68_08755 [Alphaproteobacteria bacterium]|nr:hypothetical protein [Alphaproteobacteria bacterium]
MKRRGFLLAVMGGALAGCEGLGGLLGPPANLYTLTPKSNFAADLPTVASQLVVEEPSAAGGLNSVRIALLRDGTELGHFAGAEWADRAPRMVQILLTESFENTGRIVAVGRQAIGLRSDFNLMSELREFQAEYSRAGGSPTVRVRLTAKLIRQPRRSIVDSQSFEANLPAGGADMRAIVLAFDEALGRVLRQVVEWCLRRMATGA